MTKAAVEARPKRSLTPEETASIKEEIREKEEMLKAGESFRSENDYVPTAPAEISFNRGKLTDRLSHLRGVLDREGARRIADPVERERLLKHAKDLEAQFLPYLETRRDLDAVRMDSPEYKEAFKKAQARPKVEPFIQEWKEIWKQLEPEDPTRWDLDRLRKDR